MATADALYDFQEAESHCVITLHPHLNKEPWGEIDGIGNSLLERIRSHMELHRKAKGFLVNLADLNYMGSALVALVVRLWKAIKEKNGKMAVVNTDEMVLEVLRLSGLEDVWTICDTTEDGLKAIGVRARAVAAAVPSASATGSNPTATGAVPTMSVAAEREPASPLWCVLSLVMLAVAGVGLFLMTSNPIPFGNMQVAMGMLFGGALLGLLPATVAVSRGGGMNRAVGVAGIVGAIALMVTGVAVHPQRGALLGDTKQNPTAGNDRHSPGPNPGTAKDGDQRTATKTGKTTATPKTAQTRRTGHRKRTVRTNPARRMARRPPEQTRKIPSRRPRARRLAMEPPRPSNRSTSTPGPRRKRRRSPKGQPFRPRFPRSMMIDHIQRREIARTPTR